MAKVDFAYTLNEFSNDLPKTGNECFLYGITWGCDRDCPVFARHECEIQDEVENMLREDENYDSQRTNKSYE